MRLTTEADICVIHVNHQYFKAPVDRSRVGTFLIDVAIVVYVIGCVLGIAYVG